MKMSINNALESLQAQAPAKIVSAIKNASAKSGVDFSYLMQQAKVESSFQPDAKAGTSSARGLYQFIESTWLKMVESHGDKYGIETDGLSRSQILKLRNDPDIASNMAAELALENQRALEENWGGNVGSTELYLAHFMGSGGASAFLKAMDSNPLRPASDLFPKAASANRAVFYDNDTGRQRSLAEVYDFFDRKFQTDGNAPMSGQDMVAEAAPSPLPDRKPATTIIDRRSNALMAFLTRDPGPAAGSSVFLKSLATPRTAENAEGNNSYQAGALLAGQTLIKSPVELMLLANVDAPFGSKNAGARAKSLFF